MSERLQEVASQVIGRKFDKGLNALSPREQVLFLAWCYAGELDNGGIAQFFCNSCGEHAAETVAALRVLDLNDLAAILEEASAALFPEGPAQDIDERNEQMGANELVDEKMLDAWNRRSYASGGGDRVYERLDHWYFES